MKLLMHTDDPHAELREVQFITLPTHSLTNCLAVINRQYDIEIAPHQEIDPGAYVGTMFWVRLPEEIGWQPRPYIFIPDSDNMYYLHRLRLMDGVIAYTEEIEVDCQLVGIKCLRHLSVDLDYFARVNWATKKRAGVIAHDKSPDKIRELMRVVEGTGFTVESWEIPGHHPPEAKDAALLNIKVYPHTSWYDYAARVSSCWAGSNVFNPPISLGSLSPIMAYARSVTVGYPHTFQQYLYPDLTSWNHGELRRMLFRLRDNKEFYQEQAEMAYARLVSLDLKFYENQIIDFVDSLIGAFR